MEYISRELTEKEYDKLWKRGAQAILTYGWQIISGHSMIDEPEDWYRGAYLHKADGKYEIICKVEKHEDVEEDDHK